MKQAIRRILRQAKGRSDGQGGDRPHVIIVGAGFAGLYAAKELAGQPVRVTLVDRNNYHKFQPLLYQVATAALEPEEIAHNVRDIFRRYSNVSFQLGTVKEIDPERRCLLTQSGAEIRYDYLILAAGARTNYFGVEGAREHSYPLKNLPDAIALRNRVLRQFERADRNPDVLGAGALNFVVVGGGPTGVETAGALTELFKVMQKDYRHFDTEEAHAFLIEMLPQLLPGYDEAQGTYARRVLEGRGVTVMTDTTVERVTEEAVHLKGGQPISAETLIWAAGVEASPVAALVGAEQKNDRRLVVERDLRVPGHPEIFAVGDMSAGEDEEGQLYAQLAPVAIQQGRHAARQVLRLLRGAPTEPFRYRDLGKMATIGRNAAVAELPGGLRLNGFIAWAAWIFIHIAKLIGFRNRANVFMNWAYNYFTYDRSARLILDMVPLSDEVPYEVEEIEARVKEQIAAAGQEKPS